MTRSNIASTPRAGITYRKAREIADILYTVSPQGGNSLTVRNGKRALLKMLLDGPGRLDVLPRDYGKTETGRLEAAMLIKEKVQVGLMRRMLRAGAISCHVPRAVGFNDFVQAAMEQTDAGIACYRRWMTTSK